MFIDVYISLVCLSSHRFCMGNTLVKYQTLITSFLFQLMHTICRSQWPRGLRSRSVAARLLRSWVRIPPGAWMFVCCECCVLSVRGLCDELITCPEESYRLWCVIVCDLETSRMWRPWPALGRSATEKKLYTIYFVVTQYHSVRCTWNTHTREWTDIRPQTEWFE